MERTQEVNDETLWKSCQCIVRGVKNANHN